MIKFIDLTYYSNHEHTQAIKLIDSQKAALGFVRYIRQFLNIQVIKHAAFEESEVIEGVRYTFFRRYNLFTSIPFKTHAYVRRQNPDMVLIQGLIFPLQVLFLSFGLRRSSKIIVQHHGEQPFNGIKGLLQRAADKYTDAYVFTSKGNADPWIRKRIISSSSKVFEVLEASTFFRKQNPEAAKKKLGINGDHNFLWVGRLNANKDPLTVLKAFTEYSRLNSSARLFMIYQKDDLLHAVQRLIDENNLRNVVTLVGEVAHSQLETWFSMADYYISASHSEGSGYALLEAMACACVPIVTDIPSFRKITVDGKYGFLYRPEDTAALVEILKRVGYMDCKELSEHVREYFLKKLSFNSIAESLVEVCQTLKSR